MLVKDETHISNRVVLSKQRYTPCPKKMGHFYFLQYLCEHPTSTSVNAKKLIYCTPVMNTDYRLEESYHSRTGWETAKQETNNFLD